MASKVPIQSQQLVSDCSKSVTGHSHVEQEQAGMALLERAGCLNLGPRRVLWLLHTDKFTEWMIEGKLWETSSSCRAGWMGNPLKGRDW